jgi:hypothetical protein
MTRGLVMLSKKSEKSNPTRDLESPSDEPVNSCVPGPKNDWLCQTRPLCPKSPGCDPQEEGGRQGRSQARI